VREGQSSFFIPAEAFSAAPINAPEAALENPALRLDRRSFLAALAGGAGLALLGDNSVTSATTTETNPLHHLAWVWQFSEDGGREHVRWALAQNNVGIILKTHDGTNWLGRWDRSIGAINGPRDVRSNATYFESAGVPFHAWCVVKGIDPVREAEMCAEVLSNGARSLMLDVEPPEGDQFWQGSSQDALTLGRELRRLQPNAWIGIAPDCRPWQARSLPTAEFASFCNEIAPQTYWDTYSNTGTYRLMRQYGYEVDRETFTPEFLTEVAYQTYRPYGLPIRPIGQGTGSLDSWRRFVDHSRRLGMDSVSVWRYGVATDGVWPLLKEMRPQQPPAPVARPASNSVTSQTSSIQSDPTPTPAATAATAAPSAPAAHVPAKISVEEKKTGPAIVQASNGADIRKLNPYALSDSAFKSRRTLWTGWK
jgi:hypothetical protein